MSILDYNDASKRYYLDKRLNTELKDAVTY